MFVYVMRKIVMGKFLRFQMIIYAISLLVHGESEKSSGKDS